MEERDHKMTELPGKKIKILVAHPGKQHSYRLASALKKDGRFELLYMTTIYYRENTIWSRTLSNILSKNFKEKLKSKKNHDLNDNEVRTIYSFAGLIEVFLSRYDKNRKIYHMWRSIVSHYFGRKVAKVAISEEYDAVICYDTNSAETFRKIKKANANIICILDASAASRVYMKEIYKKDMENNSKFSEKLMTEIGYVLDEQNQNYFKQEIKFSDYILAPSNFVKKSYIHSGVKDSKIVVSPYGVDVEGFTSNLVQTSKVKKKMNFVYVGGTKQLKGISYLLEAFMKIPENRASLTVIGDNTLDDSLLKEYKDRISFIGRIPHSKVPNVLEKMDVFVFPSLGEGMALSIIEALACGLPVICSENSGANDLIEEGINGFVIPIQNEEIIIEKVRWFLDNVDQLPFMKKNARATALEYSWEDYEKKISENLYNILQSKNP